MRVLALSLAAHFGWSTAASQCANSPGSCRSQQSSLMQLKALGQKRGLLQVDVATSTSAQLEGFQKFANEMIALDEADPVGDKFTNNDTLKGAVHMIHDFIEDIYDKVLYPSHLGDEQKAQSCRDVSAHCEVEQLGTTSTGSVDTIKTLIQSGTGLNSSHIAARQDFHDECELEYNKCIAYHEYRTITTEGSCTEAPQAVPTCALIGHLSEAYLKADVGSTEFNLMEKCVDVMDKWLHDSEFPENQVSACTDLTDQTAFEGEGIYDLWKTCEDAKGQCEALDAASNSNQSALDEKQCEYANEKALVCNAYWSCYKCDVAHCITECAEIQDRVRGRQADNETALRLQCLLNVLFGEHHDDENAPSGYRFDARKSASDRKTALADCKDVNNFNYHADWAITCVSDSDAAAPYDCGQLPPRPCVDSGLEYGSFGKNGVVTPFQKRLAGTTASHVTRGRDGVLDNEECCASTTNLATDGPASCEASNDTVWSDRANRVLPDSS